MKHSGIIYGKIGTHASCSLVVWDARDILPGRKIIAMEKGLFDSLHSQYRRLKSCTLWQSFFVDSVNDDGFVFLHR